MFKFSIIMPTYNQGLFIEEAVLSVLNQTNVDCELIVYDSLSTDATPDILSKYKTRIIWVREKDKGQVDAINRGLKGATGDILAWLNSDDLYMPFALKHVMDAFLEDPELEFVYGDALEIDRSGNITTPNLFTEDYNRDRYLFSHNYICQPSIFFKKSVMEKIGPMKDNLQWVMDYEWFGRFFIQGIKGKRIPFFLSANRNYPQTKTSSGGLRRYFEIIKILYNRSRFEFLQHKVFLIYTLEFFIKAINTILEKLRKDSFFYRLLSEVNRKLNNKFLLLIAPSSINDIIKRFNKNILRCGNNVNDIWEKKLLKKTYI